MKESGMSKKELSKELEKRLLDDLRYNSGKIIGSMCTSPNTFAKKVYANFLEKNLGDPGLFPGAAQLEKEVIQMMGKLLSHPEAVGNIVTGGTEANLLALEAFRHRKMECTSTSSHGEVVVPSSAHCSLDKAARLLGLKIIKTPLTRKFKADVEAMKQAITSKTIAVVGIAGTTSLGLVDPIREISELAMENNLFFHVDAAFGGFVLPFLRELGYKIPDFDFRVPGVSSITIDPHKMGLAPIPSGGILFRDSDSQKAITWEVPYLAGGRTLQTTLTGTRSGSSVIAVWALLQHLGREGYRNIVRRCMTLTQKFAADIRGISGLDLVVEPVTNVVGIKSTNIQVEKIAMELRKRGWAVSLFPNHMRIVVMPHVQRVHLEQLLRDLELVVKELGS